MRRAQQLVLIQFALFVAIAISFFVLPRWPAGPLTWIGFALILAGLALGFWAISEHRRASGHGPNVLPIPAERGALVTSGPYAQIRHPIYTGVLGCALGAALVHGHWLLFVLAFALLLLFTAKSAYEEELLTLRYRGEYEAYQRRTGRFVPRL